MIQIPIERAKAVAFTGHRQFLKVNENIIKDKISCAVLDAYKQGYRTFYNGFALGFDLLAVEAVLNLKRIHHDISLIAVMPFSGQSNKFSSKNVDHYNRLLKQADHIVTISDTYYPRCFLDRDDYMINHSSCLISYYDGRVGGGTYYTVRKGKNLGLPIVNLY